MEQWQQRHVLNFPEMDVQHAYLYRLFDSLEPTARVEDIAATKTLLREIEQYLLFHFASEEHLMRMYGVPTFTVHKSDHEQAGNLLAAFLDDFEAGRLNPGALRGFLGNWLSEHSALSDSQYATWIQDFRKNLPAPRVGDVQRGGPK